MDFLCFFRDQTQRDKAIATKRDTERRAVFAFRRASARSRSRRDRAGRRQCGRHPPRQRQRCGIRPPSRRWWSTPHQLWSTRHRAIGLRRIGGGQRDNTRAVGRPSSILTEGRPPSTPLPHATAPRHELLRREHDARDPLDRPRLDRAAALRLGLRAAARRARRAAVGRRAARRRARQGARSSAARRVRIASLTHSKVTVARSPRRSSCSSRSARSRSERAIASQTTAPRCRRRPSTSTGGLS